MLEALAKAKAPKRAVPAANVELMLAETGDKPFSKPDWIFELKLDGYRLLGERRNGSVQLLTRNHHDATATFPEIAAGLSALPYESVLLDGEVVALDDAGRPSFQRLQQRGRLSKPVEIRRMAVELPVTYFVFDLLSFGPFDLRPLPLEARKSILQRIVPAAGAIRYVDHIAQEGERLFAETERMGLEGLVAKKANAPYRAGRSASWLKLRASKSDDFVVVGFTAPKGARTGLGALHLAQYVDGALVYSGRVGSGFTDKDLAALRKELEARKRKTPPCERVPAEAKGSTWVEPEKVCEVRFTEWTDEGLLRQPVFLRWRDDKDPKDCVGKAGGRDGGKAEEAEEAVEAGEAGSGKGGKAERREKREGGPSDRRAAEPPSRRGPRASSRRPAPRSSPTSRRSSGPTMAIPRAISWTTIAPFRPGSSRTCGVVPSS